MQSSVLTTSYLSTSTKVGGPIEASVNWLCSCPDWMHESCDRAGARRVAVAKTDDGDPV
jgi:hypothetical protein